MIKPAIMDKLNFKKNFKMNIMKKLNFGIFFSLLLSLSILFSSCQAIGDIFKAGIWFGIIGIVIVVVIVFWLIGKARK